MTYRQGFNFKSAYGQLILLVFLPICILAAVGAVLVIHQSHKAAKIEQQASANMALIQYEGMSSYLGNELLNINEYIRQHQNTTLSEATDKTLQDKASTNIQTKTTKTTEAQILKDRQQVTEQLQKIMTNRHIQGIAVINDDGQILASFGDMLPPFGENNPSPLSQYNDSYTNGNLYHSSAYTFQNYHQDMKQLQQGQSVNVTNGTLYAKEWTFQPEKLSKNASQLADAHFWLVVNVDNEPLQIAHYQVLLALAVTGLITILLLLLSLNTYAKRWIAPIYEMRLHLQQTDMENLYQPMSFESQGELNLLQQDLVKTFRRLFVGFQDLKNHAEQTEDDLKKAFDEMEMKNISIRSSRDLAISASQAKSAFLANISHELRTPLNSIDGFVNLLARHGGLSFEQDLYVQTIRKSSAHLLALVNDVLDFSKMEAGKLVLDRHEFDLYDTIYDVVDMLSPIAAEKQLRMAVLFYNDVPMQIIGDALRMKQVLTNLVGNAIKFTETGEIVVKVSLDESKDNHLFIAVQDSGKGISAADEKLLFKSFSQGDPSITRQYGGTGLGLIISKQLTELMGGDIGFYDNSRENIANQGATFWFTMPTHVDVSNVPTGDSINLPILAPLANNHDIFQVLAWIDHPATIQVLKASLQPLPIQLTQANSLAGVLDLLKERGNDWHWVIVDADNQEDMTALLKQIRLHYQGKLAIFGYQVSFDRALINRYQANTLHEPLDKRQLYTMLDSQTTQQKPNIEPPKWQGITVLAVDDHLPNLLVLDALLSELGIQVLTANSGFDAIEIMSRYNHSHTNSNTPTTEQIDLIFMDIQMPKMSGKEAATQIRKIENPQKRIPIIALTAHGLSDEKDKLMASGIDDYVGKPISQSQLLQILQKWLGKTSDEPTFTQQPRPYDSLTQPTSPKEQPAQASTTSDKLAIIDWQDALTRSANKPELASKLIMMMIDTIDDEKQALTEAWEKRDRANLAQIAHRILGASRYTGVPELRQASQNFEDKCLLNVQHTSPTQFSMLHPYYKALQDALDNLKQADLSAYPQLRYHQLTEDDMTWKMI